MRKRRTQAGQSDSYYSNPSGGAAWHAVAMSIADRQFKANNPKVKQPKVVNARRSERNKARAHYRNKPSNPAMMDALLKANLI